MYVHTHTHTYMHARRMRTCISMCVHVALQIWIETIWPDGRNREERIIDGRTRWQRAKLLAAEGWLCTQANEQTYVRGQSYKFLVFS